MKSMETKKKIVTVVIHAVLIFVSITMLVPFLWMILTAFKSVTEATSVNPFVIFPKVWRTDSFKAVMENMNFLLWYKNTLLLISSVYYAQYLQRLWQVMPLAVCTLEEKISAFPWC